MEFAIQENFSVGTISWITTIIILSFWMTCKLIINMSSSCRHDQHVHHVHHVQCNAQVLPCLVLSTIHYTILTTYLLYTSTITHYTAHSLQKLWSSHLVHCCGHCNILRSRGRGLIRPTRNNSPPVCLKAILGIITSVHIWCQSRRIVA